MIKRMIMMLMAVGVLFGGIFGYKAFMNAMMMKYMTAGDVKPVAVSSMKIAEYPWQPLVKAVGSLRAVRGVDVASEVSGIVEEVAFKSGDMLKAGDVLVRLNAESDLALLRSLKVGVTLAQTVYDRDVKQLAVQAISQAVVDADEAQLKSRQAELAQQQAQVDKKTIHAPFDGKAGISRVNPGQYLNPGEKIVTLQALGSILVDFYIPQQEVARVAVGQKVDVLVDAYPERKFLGVVTVINPRVEDDSRNVLVEALMDNAKNELFPGMFVTAEVEAGAVNQYVTIPQSAVTFNPYGATVYFLEKKNGDSQAPGMVARQTFITTGETRGDQVAVLKGLKAGDEIVTSGQMKLKNGSPVVVNNEVVPANDAAPQPVDQ
ncbi:MAG: efflux RND transporter periplasmic adaptor subunit [Candidatus Omnitrophota bacterium]